MNRNRHNSKKNERYVQINKKTWVEVPDDTPDDIVRERFRQKLHQQNQTIAHPSKKDFSAFL
jgi:hypothetical protein